MPQDIRELQQLKKKLSESLEIARDVAHKIIEAKEQRAYKVNLLSINESFDYPLIVNL